MQFLTLAELFISPIALSYPLSHFTSEELLEASGAKCHHCYFKRRSSSVPEGLNVLFKAAELVQDKLA